MRLTALCLYRSLGEHEESERRHCTFQDTGSHLAGDSPNGTSVPLKELIHLLRVPENVPRWA